MRTIWIATGAHDPYSTGAHDRPFRANDGEEFDEIFQNIRDGTRFILKPGTYRTRGCWNFPQHGYSLLGANSEILGEYGPDATILKLDDNPVVDVGGSPAKYIETLMAGKGTASSACAIRSLTVDCATTTGLPVSGIHTFSGKTIIADVDVINVSGKWGGPEGFGILTNNSSIPDGEDGGHVVFRCRVQVNGPDNYVTGIYVGSVARGQFLRPSSVSDCFVTATDEEESRAHAAYSGNEYVRFTNCDMVGLNRFFFADTGNVGDIEITGCKGDYGYCCIDLPAPVSDANPIAYRRRIRVSDSTFTNKRPSADHAIALLVQDNSEGNRQVALEDIDVDGLRIVQTGLSDPSQFYVVSIKGLLTSRIWVRNSRFVPGCQTRGGVWPPTPQSSVDIDDVPDSASKTNLPPVPA